MISSRLAAVGGVTLLFALAGWFWLSRSHQSDPQGDGPKTGQSTTAKATASGNGPGSNPSSAAPPVSEIVLAPPPQSERPAKVSANAISAFYPVGKRVRSMADLSAQGTGTNKAWGFQGEASFVYLFRCAVETEVVASQDDSVTFRQRFSEVSQTRIVSDRTLELSMPESPLLNVVWEQIEPELRPLPHYRVGKWMKKIADVADPNAKRTLTFLSQIVRRLGIPLDPHRDPMDFEQSINDLEGAELEFTYVSGLGVTHARVLHGLTVDPQALEMLGHNSSLFLDYFIGQALETPIGQSIEIRAQDLAGLMRFGFDVSARGKLTFRRQPDDRGTATPTALLVLAPIGGEVSLSRTVDGVQLRTHTSPVAGTIEFSPEERIVRRARGTWDSRLSRLSEDHLLFGTENIRNLTVETRYSAETIRD